jgi:hypothetical protein
MGALAEVVDIRPDDAAAIEELAALGRKFRVSLKRAAQRPRTTNGGPRSLGRLDPPGKSSRERTGCRLSCDPRPRQNAGTRLRRRYQ